MAQAIQNEVIKKGNLAKKASYEMIHKTTEQKNNALQIIANMLVENSKNILDANAKDIQNAMESGIPAHVRDRILLTEERIQAIYESILQCIELHDPIGEILEENVRADGLKIVKKRVPLGVVGIIYEARPNVTVDAAILALKTSNVVVLRGSSSAIESNKALVKIIQQALKQADFPVEAVQLIEDTSRETAKTLFTLKEYLDVLIPRGGKALIDTVVQNATVPVIETGAGNCHIYIDESAIYEKAEKIILNAKLQRPSVCNACESILLHKQFYLKHGETLINRLLEAGVQIYGDNYVQQLHEDVLPATDEHYADEFLSLALSAHIVTSVEEAVDHIHRYSTQHSEAIVTEDEKAAHYFIHSVDSAAVYHNASTRFTDGFEFGYGAEIGISTQKLHARGPMGLAALTSTKYTIFGDGHIRT